MFIRLRGVPEGEDNREAIDEFMHTRMAAEEKARLVGNAKREALEQTERAREALGRNQSESSDQGPA